MARRKKRSLIVNFKAYKKGTGKNALRLAKKLSKVSNGNVIVAVQIADLYRLHKLNIPVYTQHMDPIKYGAFTGHDLGEALRENGAHGILVNHSEDKMNAKDIRQTIKIAKRLKMKTVVCIDKPKLAKRVARMKPDMIAIEPPELIGTGISVSKAKPKIVTKTVKAVKEVNNTAVLCGAGISTEDDVRKAMKLGCKGVLVSSAIVNSKEPDKLLRKFLRAME